jgi:hypothetical protein
MTTVLSEEYKMGIHVIAFKGDCDNWCQWKTKTKAIVGMKKKWVKALETDYSYENWTAVLTDVQKAKKKWNSVAWNFLVMACKNEPFNIIPSDTESNAYRGWELLKEEYEPSTDEDLINIQEKFVTCKIVTNTDNPALWIDKLKVINKRLGGIAMKYEKGDINMISYIMANFPKEYSEVVTVLKANRIANKSINNLRLAVQDMWERTIENKTEKTKKKSAEQSLNMGHKKCSKKFKGDCGYCGKQGHKKENCFKKKR